MSAVYMNADDPANTGYVAQVAKTGQTTSYQTGDDGTYQKGISFVTPRFTSLSAIGVVIDNLTGLMWTQDINYAGATKTWTVGIDYCEALSLGGYSDWRMPNLNEMRSLFDYGNNTPALPTGHPFTGEELTSNISFFTSTTKPGGVYTSPLGVSTTMSNFVSIVGLKVGQITDSAKIASMYIWPVRG